MPCRSCQSGKQKEFPSEINIRFPGMKGLDKPTVWAFPELHVCLDCGFTEFRVEETDLRQLEQGTDEKASAHNGSRRS